MTPRISPVLKWHGGKNYLAKHIVSLMPQHTHYVEPFAGGLAVLLAKDPDGVSEVVNDLNGDLTNFWRVLQHPDRFLALHRQLEATPFGRSFWANAKAIDGIGDAVDRAANFFIRVRQSLAGRGADFAPLSRTRTRRGMNEQVSAWLTAIEGLPAAHARLKRVVVENMTTGDLIAREDGPDTLFYLDPPYLQSTRTAPDVYGDFEMSEAEHDTMLTYLGSSLKGKFLLSGYRSALYDNATRRYGWHRIDFDLPNHAASGKEKRRMTESVWANFPLPQTENAQ